MKGFNMKQIQKIGIATLAFLTLTQMASASDMYNAPVQKNCVAAMQQHNEDNTVIVEGLDKPAKVELHGKGAYSLNGKEMGQKEAIVQNGDRLTLDPAPSDEKKARSTLVVGDAYKILAVKTGEYEVFTVIRKKM
jgi:hypothetical protein